MVPLVIAGLAMSAASGVMGAISGASQAKAEAMQQEINQRNANFEKQWQIAVQNRNTMRQWQAALESNMQLEKSANKERALSELYTEKSYRNATSQLSKQTSEANAAFLSAASGRNIDASRGSARALLRQNMTSAGDNLLALKQNYEGELQSIEAKQQTRLASRANTMFPGQIMFMPSQHGVIDNSSAVLTTGLIKTALDTGAKAFKAMQQYGGKPKDSMSFQSDWENMGPSYAELGYTGGTNNPINWSPMQYLRM